MNSMLGFAEPHAWRDSLPTAVVSCWGLSRGSAGGGSSSAGSGPAAALEDWEEAELALLPPENQKRERRRIANRDCARRIRQRKTELLSELATAVAGLQADKACLLAKLTEVSRCWRDTTLQNCALRSQLGGQEAASCPSNSTVEVQRAAARQGTGSPPPSWHPQPLPSLAQELVQ